MSADKLIDLIEQRRVLSERLVAKLRAKIVDSAQPMTAASLAKFLVQKNHISHSQAKELLDSLSSGNLSNRPDEPAANNSVERRASDLIVDPANDDDKTSDSSIFSSLLPGKAQRGRSNSTEDQNEFVLVPIDEQYDDSADLEDAGMAPAPPAIVDLAPLSAQPRQSDDAIVETALTMDSLPKVEGRVKAKVANRLASNTKLLGPGESRKKKPKRKSKAWDSPLLLIGGGALALLLLVGGGVAFYLRAGGGDQMLADARAARDAGSYSQAVQRYEEFLEKHSRHSDWSAGRVELGMVQLRQAVEGGGNLQPALAIAQQELPEIEDEPRFGDVRNELAELLPALAAGLAMQAEKDTGDPAEAERLAKASEEALALCRTAKYVPKALRDDAELAAVEETLARARQHQETRAQLTTSIASMKAAIAAGDPRTAYATHKQLLRDHPELSANAELAAMVVETSAAEKAGVKFVVDEHVAETTERPTPWVAILATGNRLPGAGSPANGVYCANIDGALYAFDIRDGRLLWRRYLGFGNTAKPVVVGDHVLAADSRYQELLRLDARSGKLIWRQSIGEPFATPLAVGARAYVAAESGRLYVIDLESGDRMGYLQFAQPLRVTPAVDRTGETIYLTGDHSSIYTVSLRELTCDGVNYLGHSSGSIRVPPALVLNKIAVIENDGVATCRLRLLSLDEDGSVAKQEAQHRLAGLAAAPPLVAARRLIVVTDRGELDAFDVTGDEGEQSLTLVATREASSQQPLMRHVLMTQGAIWIGDSRLTKYAVVPTGNRLPVESIENSFAGETFDHPFGLFGDTLVSVHRPKGRAGVVVSAIDTESGRLQWENELAVPPAATPVVDDSTRTIAFADVNGLVYRFDEQAVRSRVQDQPLSPGVSAPGAPKLTSGTDLGAGRAAFAVPAESDRVLLYDPAAARQPLRWTKLPGVVACATSPFGEGVVVPLEIGQVFYIDPQTGQSIARPFQPRLQPRTKLHYQPACQVDEAGRQFVITDGFEKVYLVEVVDGPQPHLAAAAEANVGPYPVVSPFVVLGEKAFAVTQAGQLARFQLPSLENAGQTELPADVVWGPYRADDVVLLATADEKLVAVDAEGAVKWIAPLTGGELAGPPLAADDAVFVAYRRGTLEKRTLSDGQSVGSLDVEHPLAAGPVRFLGRIVLAAHDGTLLVVDEP